MDDMFRHTQTNRHGQTDKQSTKLIENDLEALSVNNGRTRLVVFLLADPHLLEGGQRREDGSTDPYGIFTLGRCDDLDLHRGRCECVDFFLHAVGNAGTS